MTTQTYTHKIAAHILGDDGTISDKIAYLTDAVGADQLAYDGQRITVAVEGDERQAILRGDLYALGQSGTGDPVVELVDARAPETHVVTWGTPSGAEVDITPAQEQRLSAAHVWPRSEQGEEYCQVQYGLHSGEPTYTDAEIDAMIAERDAGGETVAEIRDGVDIDQELADTAPKTVRDIHRAAGQIAGAAWDDHDPIGTLADQLRAVAATTPPGGDGDLTEADRTALRDLADEAERL